MYKEFGIDDKIIEYGKKIEAKLEERFKAIDEVAE